MAKRKSFHLLVYVEKCQTKVKKFMTLEEMNFFKKGFKAKYPEWNDREKMGDNWLDYEVTDISGKVVFHDKSIRLE